MTGRVIVLRGDAGHLPLPDCSVDAVVCDPPYNLEFLGRDWDALGTPSAFQQWCERWGRECLRVLKPGGHLLAFGSPRTYHRLAAGIEDAAFEVRDSLHWIYGTGMPKGQDIAKVIDRRRDDRDRVLQVTAWLAAARDAAGWTNRRVDALFGTDGMARHWTTGGMTAVVPTPVQWDQMREALGFDDTEIRPLVGELNARKGSLGEDWARREVTGQGFRRRGPSDVQIAALSAGTWDITAPASDAARQWEGWNTQLRPAHEPVVMARKSTGYNSTVANVLLHGTGALNIGGCLVPDGGSGRWPSNILLGHSPDCSDGGDCTPGCPVAALDQQSGIRTSGANPSRRGSDKFRDVYGAFAGQAECKPRRGADSGGASRFFPVFRYEAKAPASERPRLSDGTAWPTVKPVALMQWLIRLVTPQGGVVLDLFCGSGSTGQAALIEGFNAILVDKDPQAIALTRVRLAKPVQPLMFAVDSHASPVVVPAPAPPADMQGDLFGEAS